MSRSKTLWLDTRLMDTLAVYTVQTCELSYLLKTEGKNKGQISQASRALICAAVLSSLRPRTLILQSFHWADWAVSSLSWRRLPPLCTRTQLSLLEPFLHQISEEWCFEFQKLINNKLNVPLKDLAKGRIRTLPVWFAQHCFELTMKKLVGMLEFDNLHKRRIDTLQIWS